jgi:nitrogen fixation/metabolism regulation signal transduction histidine kinase
MIKLVEKPSIVVKKIISFLFLVIAVNQTYCQQQQLDSLKNELRIATADSTRISLIIAIGNIYFAVQPDSSLHYFKKGADLIHKSSVSIGRSTILNRAGDAAVTVATRKLNGKLEIKVTDNGNGIPAAIKEKVFQPFFTTKPTGQGTGLGLSLSYDTVKAHGGELIMETEEGHGTSFTIQLTL